MSRIKAVIFDVDGTILSSEEAICRRFKAVFEKFGFETPTDKKIMKFIGQSNRNWTIKLLPANRRKDKKLIDKITAYSLEIYKSYYLPRYARLIPGTKRTLKKLKRKYKLAIVTGNRKKVLRFIIKKFGLKNIFRVLIGEEDTKKIKPNPDPVIKAVKKLGVKKSECIFVGDTIFDVRAGKAAGVKTVAVLTGWQTRSILKKQNPDYIIKSINELPRLLDAHEKKQKA